MDIFRTIFEINGDFGRKSQLSPPRVFNALPKGGGGEWGGGSNLNFITAIGLKKTRHSNRMSKYVTICAFV